MREQWTDKKVYDAIMEIVRTTGQSHFPTHRQMNEYYGNKGLSGTVSKRGGNRRWTEICHLPPAKCKNTAFGDKYEIETIEDIKRETGLESILAPVRFPYDVYTDNSVKIDIKASMPLRGRNFDIWSFNLEKKIPTCDLYIFYCITRRNEATKRVIIPACVLSGVKQVGIGSMSKYDNYIERWDLIIDYANFQSNMSKRIKLIPRRRTTNRCAT